MGAVGLDGCVRSDFQLIKEQLSVSDSTLSKHITALETAGLVEVTKGFIGKRAKTWVSLSDQGKAVFASHMQGLTQIAELSVEAPEKA